MKSIRLNGKEIGTWDEVELEVNMNGVGWIGDAWTYEEAKEMIADRLNINVINVRMATGIK